jgi:MFS transporter, SP family, solute carrier family 2 (myo-inositol transporter), member 13
MVDGVFIELFPNDGWRYMLGLAVIPGLVMFYGFWKLPESPRWLVQKGNHDLALQVLTTLRESDQEAIDEIAEILESVASHCDKPNQDDDVDDSEPVQHQQRLDEPSREYGTVARTPEVTKVSDGVISRSIEMLSNGPTRRAVVLGCGIMVIQQCCGINT